VTRLLDMGMDPFSFADSLLAVLAQRLVRRLCRKCVQARPASDEEIEALLHEYLSAFPDAERRPARDAVLTTWLPEHGTEGRLQYHHAGGCKHCLDSGFQGRVGLHELLLVDRELRHLIQTSARSEQLQAAAMHTGMRTLRQDGVAKVLAGLTTLGEVRSITNQ
jgi:type II secretory ATPase GspE/PulE/Tfp pilus assembly ATPase PilB-like protein